MPNKRSKRAQELDSPISTALGDEEGQGTDRRNDGQRNEDPSGDDQGTRASSQIGDEVNRLIESQLARGNESLRAVANAIDATAEQLREQSPRFAKIAQTVSQRVGDFAGHVENHSASELLDEATRLGRRWPAAFFAGAIAVGFLASRFIKSSASRGGTGTGEEFEPVAGDARHAGP